MPVPSASISATPWANIANRHRRPFALAANPMAKSAINSIAAVNGNPGASGMRLPGEPGISVVEGGVVVKQTAKFAGSVTVAGALAQDCIGGVPVTVAGAMHGMSAGETVHAITMVPCAPLGESSSRENTAVHPCAAVCVIVVHSCATVCIIELVAGGSTQNSPVAVPLSAIVCGLPGALSTSVSAALLAAGTFTQTGANIT